MARKILLAYCFLQIVVFALGAGIYSVVGPGTIHSNFKYSVAISLHKAEGPAKIQVGITGPSYNESKIVQVDPMSTKTVDFDVPNLSSGEYNLTSVGLSGITFENSTSLNVADSKPSIFIQTDKATYKPGDLVQFRVIFLDENTRPAKINTPVNIEISDALKNILKQIKNVKFTKGVYTDSFPLSAETVLGDWTISVYNNGEKAEQKVFEVAKYVLPKFDVTIDTAKDVAIPSNVIKATVRSKYTYGKPVKGKAVISVSPSYHYYGSFNDNLVAEKTIDVDGKGHVEFDLTKDLRLSADRSYVPPLNILVVMEEALTGNKQNTSTTVNLHIETYRIEGVNTPYSFHPGKPVVFTIVVKNLDGTPVQDTKNSAKLLVDSPRGYFHRTWIPTDMSLVSPVPEPPTMEFESKLDKNGMATFEFTLPTNAVSYYSVRAKYLDSNAYLSSLSQYSAPVEQVEKLKITVTPEKPHLKDNVTVEVLSKERIPYFVYTIVGRGNILKSEHVEVPEASKSHKFTIVPTFEMMPKFKILIHYVFENDLQFEEHTVNMEKGFENSIAISAPVEVKPGDDVKLDVQTDPDSYVGLLGVDQSVLLLKSGNDIKKDDVFNKIEGIDTSTPWMRGYGRYPGQQTGLVTMTNANYPYNHGYPYMPVLYDSYFVSYAQPLAAVGFAVPGSATVGVGAFARPQYGAMPVPSQPPRIRKLFLEAWIWDDINTTGPDGLKFTKKIPDTITSWVITGFSINPKTGFALTDDATKIRVFQPFFIFLNLPHSVKRGEAFALPVILNNYMSQPLTAEVTMDNTDGDYQFIEATNEVDENSINEVKRVKRVTIPANSGASVSFLIRPNRVGDVSMKITAITPVAGDSIHQPLKVEPEGVPVYKNDAVFINLQETMTQNGNFNINIPPEAVPDSEVIDFSVIGDVLGPTLNNLDQLVRKPYGCGEQNMINFVPNILVLRYLDATNKSMPSLRDKAKGFVENGYQRELTYKHDNGAYSAFGKSDPSGSTWLTAYVVRSFHQAAKFIFIDPNVNKQGLNYLASVQAENGSFTEHARLLDSTNHNKLVITAFVLMAFFENVEHIPEYEKTINKGLAYLRENVDQTDDLYATAIIAYTLKLANDPKAEKVLAKLETLAKEENGQKSWSKDSTKSMNNAVELTSYVALAKLNTESAEEALPIIKWLVAQRNSNGGFQSTQDTVVGLQALTKFAEKTSYGSGEVEIDFESNGGEKRTGNMKVNADNALVLQTHVLPKTTRHLSYTAKGRGSAIAQLSYRYNIAEKEKKPSFTLNTKVNNATLPNLLVLEICAEYKPLENAEPGKESNMAVMEVSLPSGYTADADTLTKIDAVDRVKLAETKDADSTVIVYFDSLAVGDIKCVPVEASKTHPVAKLKPAPVAIYDYYVSDQRETEYYTVPSSLCDICEGEDCGEACKGIKR
ncbi:CD109 antigen-like isoform X3 [Teleopsis dalmanni]|uniref:CD109 antigen-like isoform X3 n=1 Tax=Teleopsis dalmanni TaxID=139649 RepID=UPI0018CC89C0|nr:CD109 antigen-like isoform X3 [Teleopsis dalmanni]